MEFIIETDISASLEDEGKGCQFDCGSNCIVDLSLDSGVSNGD